MSTPVLSNDVLVDAIESKPSKPKTVKPPVLSAKYSKLLLFGFQLIQQFKSDNLLSSDEVDNAYKVISLFSSIEEQKLYYENFFLNIKSSTKEMKNVIKLQSNANKIIKPKKETKKRKGKNISGDDTDTTSTDTLSTDATDATDAVVSEKKRGRKKKDNSVVHDKQDQIVIDLIAAANNPESVIPTSESTTETATATTDVPPTDKKYNRKPKKDNAILATKELIMNINNENITKNQAKTKAKKQPTTPPATEQQQPIVEETPIVEEQPIVEETPIVEEESLPKTKQPKAKSSRSKENKTKPSSLTDDNAIDTQPKTTKAKKSKEDTKAKKDDTKAKKDDTKATKKDTVEIVPPPPSEQEEGEQEEEEEGEEIEAMRFVYKGIQYLIDENTQIVYVPETFDVVGKYNKTTDTIQPIV